MNVVQELNLGDHCFGVFEMLPYSMPKTILVIEHDVHLRFLLEKALEKISCKTIGISGLYEIYTTLSENSIDLILVDLVANHWEDFNTCRQICQHFDVPIVILSEQNKITANKHAKQLGAVAYLAKPIRLRELHYTVASVLLQAS